MRISDGSSDVCSSDLQVGGGRKELPTLGGFIQRAKLPELFHWLEKRVAFHAREQVPVAGHHGRSDRRGGEQIGFHHRPEGDFGAEAEATHADRSEEHTSELQSLMRISYAVFCLKNKTNTQ